MAWATPPIVAVGTVATAANWNILANDLKFLVGTLGLMVAATVSTATTSYVTLTGGPSATVTTGTHAIVLLSGNMVNSVGTTAYSQMAYKITGATTRAASATHGYIATNTTTSAFASACIWVTGLTAGSNTFTAVYSVSATSTGHWTHRSLIVIPLP